MSFNYKKGLSLYQFCAYLLLPVMLVNMTVSENKWEIFGFSFAVPLYILTIVFAWYIVLKTRYSVLLFGMLLLAVTMRLMDLIASGDSFRYLSYIPLAWIYMMAGATIYGNTPKLLHKQLVVFLALCVPIMIAQILGVSQWVMVWDTSFLDNSLSSFTNDDVGKFKDIALYPTLFVNLDDFQNVIGQARPAGLTHNNNVLSIFISLAIALNIAIDRLSRLTLSDMFITLAAVLSMSKLVFGTAILIYVGYIFFGSRQKKFISLKLILIFMFALVLYYLMFPGLFLSHFSVGRVMTSIMLRLVDLIGALGLSDILPSIAALGELYRPGAHYIIGEGYTLWATVLRSPYAIYLIALIVIVLGLYYLRVRRINPRDAIVYKVTLLVCVFTQFSVPFYQQNSFQLIIGFALFPLFRKLWSKDICKIVDSVGKKHT